MSASAEQLRDQLQAITDELSEWVSGRRSWTNLVPSVPDPVAMAQRQAGVTAWDEAHVRLLLAQLDATKALLQLDGEQTRLAKVWWEGYRAAAQDNKITDPETEFVPNPYETETESSVPHLIGCNRLQGCEPGCVHIGSSAELISSGTPS